MTPDQGTQRNTPNQPRQAEQSGGAQRGSVPCRGKLQELGSFFSELSFWSAAWLTLVFGLVIEGGEHDLYVLNQIFEVLPCFRLRNRGIRKNGVGGSFCVFK